MVERISSDDEQEVYGGDLDTKFTYTKENNNRPDKYVCDICEKVFRDNMNDETICHITTKNCIDA